jgi:HSP20 family protein
MGYWSSDVTYPKSQGVLSRYGYHVRERRYGSFRRSMSLPEGVDESKIQARSEDGVLEVRVEGAAIEQAPKRIEIERSGG